MSKSGNLYLEGKEIKKFIIDKITPQEVLDIFNDIIRSSKIKGESRAFILEENHVTAERPHTYDKIIEFKFQDLFARRVRDLQWDYGIVPHCEVDTKIYSHDFLIWDLNLEEAETGQSYLLNIHKSDRNYNKHELITINLQKAKGDFNPYSLTEEKDFGELEDILFLNIYQPGAYENKIDINRRENPDLLVKKVISSVLDTVGVYHPYGKEPRHIQEYIFHKEKAQLAEQASSS